MRLALHNQIYCICNKWKSVSMTYVKSQSMNLKNICNKVEYSFHKVPNYVWKLIPLLALSVWRLKHLKSGRWTETRRKKKNVARGNRMKDRNVWNSAGIASRTVAHYSDRQTDRRGITFTPAASGLRAAEIIHYTCKSIILTGCS
jgi:hypothetical protein